MTVLRQSVTVIVLAAIAAPLFGCFAVGPDYRGPDSAAPLAESGKWFRRAPLAPVQRIKPSAAWWLALKDPLLTRLIEQSFIDSPSIDMAVAKLRQARAGARQQVAGLFPTLTGNGSAQRNVIGLGDIGQKIGQETARVGGQTAVIGAELASRIPKTIDLDIYSGTLQASWELDIFGGQKRAVEGAVAQAEATEAQLADAHVQLAAQVAQSYVNLRDAQGRLRITLRAVDLQRKSLDLTSERFDRGTASDADVQRLRTQFEQTTASADPLRLSIDQALTQIATLVGFEAGVFEAQLRRSGGLPRLPRRIEIGDPAGVLRRRPDIRQAERSLAAANAQIGQSVAELFPKVSLAGSLGSMSFSPQTFATPGSIMASAGPKLQWNIFDFGRTLAQIQQSEAATDAAFAQYKNAVLSALQDAENALAQYGRTGSQVAALSRATAAASKASDLTRESQQGGTVSVVDLINVEQTRLQTELNLAQSQAQLVNTYVLLQKSLGLGWGGSVSPTPRTGTNT